MPGEVELVDIDRPVYRIVPSRFPPINLFEWAEGPEFEALAALEGDTNDRLLNEAGALNLVPVEDRIYGSGSTPVMAAFTHPGSDNRFNGEEIGAYYGALTKETAIAETRFHRQRFMEASKEEPCSIQMRCYQNRVAAGVQFETLFSAEFASLFHDSTDYSESQAYANSRRADGAAGFYYPSVRDHDGECIVAFRPNAMTTTIQCNHYEYFWDGEAISDVFEMVAQDLT